MSASLLDPSLEAPIADRPSAPARGVDSLLSDAKIGPRDGAGRTAVVAMSGGVDSAVTALVMR